LKRKVLRDFGFEAIAQVLIESGMETKLAQHRAKDYAIAVQGVLILTQGFDEEM
jgi:TetR/AcrR family transcriptional regulator, lmrAB and yxaGH operons repressor